MTAQEILTFWFQELSPSDWWKSDPKLDQQIAERFGALHQQAILGELFTWRDSAHSRLAEIIVLDQFSRNIYRGDARAFAADPMALALAQEMVGQGLDQNLSATESAFAYLPYMHSESLVIHQEALKLYSRPGLEFNYEFEVKHKVIIERFGRYPHRNEVLGRQSSAEEIEFLKGPNSSF